QPSLA
ncbi:lipocalin-like domain protein, partial [Vibrio cholerae O1 str. AG-7404]